MIKSILYKCQNENCRAEWEGNVSYDKNGQRIFEDDGICPNCLEKGSIGSFTSDLRPEPKLSGIAKLKDWIKNNTDYFIQCIIAIISTLVILIPRHLSGDLNDVKPIVVIYIFVFLVFLGTYHIMFKVFDILDILLDKPIDKLLNGIIKSLNKKLKKLKDQEPLREAKRKSDGVKKPPVTHKPNIKPTARPRI